LGLKHTTRENCYFGPSIMDAGFSWSSKMTLPLIPVADIK
jgi:hypothetical protein